MNRRMKLSGFVMPVIVLVGVSLLFSTVGLGQSLLVHDVAVKQITDPHGARSCGTYYMQPGPMAIAAIIQNLGEYLESGLTCTAQITDLYSAGVTGLTLDIGTEQPVAFPNATLDAEGYYTLSVSLPLDGDVNPANNVKNLTIGVDATPPYSHLTVNGEVGCNGWYLSLNSITISSIDSMSGVTQIRIKVDDGPWTTYTVPIVFSSPGSHTISFYAIDKAGNIETPKSETIRVDGEPPELQVTKQITLTSIIYTAIIDDTLSGPDRVEWYLEDVLQVNDTDGSNGFTFTLSPIPSGDLHVDAVAFDKAGNSVSVQQTTSPSSHQQGSQPLPYSQHFSLIQQVLNFIQQNYRK